jgi:hypothetical protein
MKKSIIFILSELLMYALTLGVVIIVHPAIPIHLLFIVAAIVYGFATSMSLLLEFTTKIAVNYYYDRKEKNK